MSQGAELITLVAEAIDRARWSEPGASARELAHAAVTTIAASEGWHIISSAEVTREDDPPIPDHAVDDMSRFAMRPPQRITTVKLELDGEAITARGTVNREMLQMASSGYQDHADRQLGVDFLFLVGHRLGVPGCEDVPERLAKAGHP